MDWQVEALKEEFARLETTSTTRITQLEAALEVERNKLKEYELLEIDLDSAVVQTVITTFGAIPTTTKRRFQQSVLLAQKVVKSQREAIALEQKLAEVSSDRERLQQEAEQLKTKLASSHQPQSYLIDKLDRREQELQTAVGRYQETQAQLQQLRAQYQQVQDANASLQQQLQQLLSRRGDLDALKTTVSPPPSIASKMTRPPTPQHHEDDLSTGRPPSEVSNASSISSTPKWYTKLRSSPHQTQ
ncbi:hypothetical protein PHMEG_0004437 [Phytophthora megakarya]|uniref:Uncharacterized protein n=1 Tax=Phytophthora megakarya TaxID=4795 RepID=A0A225WTU7_9STRA|nr:hypothetical protein PHMEG_0004437 [Phytophthora megakarya]